MTKQSTDKAKASAPEEMIKLIKPLFSSSAKNYVFKQVIIPASQLSDTLNKK